VIGYLRRVRIAIGVTYDGSSFDGWQSQPSGNTVQDHLETALAAIAGTFVRVAAAGRTDSGVHATGQVAHFDVEVERPLSAWVRGTNAHLPEAIAVQWAHPISPAFHARFSASARAYRYVLYNHAVRPSLLARHVGWFHLPLDERVMQEAAQALLGTHDFSAFRAAECQARTPVRTLTRLDVTRRGDHVVFELRANAFLHHMVRNIVGCLVYVGKGKHPPEWLGEVLAGRDRARAAPTFEAAGLYLAGVEYEARWGLPGAPRHTFFANDESRAASHL
jgi:tRNA pseudouridine38-40 synthase